MKETLANIKSKLKEFPHFTATLEEGFWNDSIIIKIGHTKKFEIDFMAFGGFILYYFDYLFTEEKIEINLPERSDVKLWDMIDKIILGEREKFKKEISEIEEDYEKIKSKEDIIETYQSHEGHQWGTFLLALKFGTEKDIEEMKKIILANLLAGYDLEDYTDIHEKLYPKLGIKEEE